METIVTIISGLVIIGITYLANYLIKRFIKNKDLYSLALQLTILAINYAESTGRDYLATHKQKLPSESKLSVALGHLDRLSRAYPELTRLLDNKKEKIIEETLRKPFIPEDMKPKS